MNTEIHADTPRELVQVFKHLTSVSLTTPSAMEVPEAPLVDQEEVVDQQGATPAVLEVEVSHMVFPEDQEEAADPGEVEDPPVDHHHTPSDLGNRCTGQIRSDESLTESTATGCPVSPGSERGS